MKNDTDVQNSSMEDLNAARMHLEDLDIFVGQRSRMHPGPGWALALAMVREDLAIVRRELVRRDPASIQATTE